MFSHLKVVRCHFLAFKTLKLIGKLQGSVSMICCLTSHCLLCDKLSYHLTMQQMKTKPDCPYVLYFAARYKASCVWHASVWCCFKANTICQCKLTHMPSSQLQQPRMMSVGGELLLYGHGAIDEYSNKQVLKQSEMKGKTGSRMEDERRKRYVILSWMNTESFRWSQRETSEVEENMVHLSSISPFVFSKRKAECKF